jgi:rRNA-processing protein EBP2|eukprot:COSAG06_NODE_1759_length_8453_cov_3.819129_1_plen_396_part_00
MGKKRRNGRTDVLTKQFVGKSGELVDPTFREGTGAAKGFTVASMGTGHSESEEEAEDPQLSHEESEDEDDDAATAMYGAGDGGSDDEDAEEARRELALEMAAVRQIHADRAAANGEAAGDDDDDDDEEEEEGPSSGYRQPRKYDRQGLDSALERVIQRAPSGKRPGFVEMMTVTGATAVQDVVTDVHDDLQREAAFYDNCLKGVKTAFGKLDALKLDYLRPDDYYAEMLKSDEHMSKVKEKLLFEKEKIGEKEAKRKLRDNQKLGKKVQAEREQQKAIKKKSDLNSIKQWRSDRKNQRGGEGGAGGEAGLNTALAGTYQKAKAEAKKSAKDAKFGYGGMKRKQKSNDRASVDDMSQYSGRQNKSMPKGMSGPKNTAMGKGNVRKKRAGKSKRQGR